MHHDMMRGQMMQMRDGRPMMNYDRPMMNYDRPMMREQINNPQVQAQPMMNNQDNAPIVNGATSPVTVSAGTGN